MYPVSMYVIGEQGKRELKTVDCTFAGYTKQILATKTKDETNGNINSIPLFRMPNANLKRPPKFSTKNIIPLVRLSDVVAHFEAENV